MRHQIPSGLSAHILFQNGFLQGAEEELAAFVGEQGAELDRFAYPYLNLDGARISATPPGW
jgi:hypothetical protein